MNSYIMLLSAVCGNNSSFGSTNFVVNSIILEFLSPRFMNKVQILSVQDDAHVAEFRLHVKSCQRT